MDGTWSLPTETGIPLKPNGTQGDHSTADALRVEHEKYYALVVDSGAIIKHSGFSTLHNSAQRYFTVQGVIDEIRDNKARNHLESLPFELKVREPSPEGLTQVVEFSKKTGDYSSLSSVDIHVLALLYDLEKEGCKTVSHIRKEPKRALTGKIVPMSKVEEVRNDMANNEEEVNDLNFVEQTSDTRSSMKNGEEFFQAPGEAIRISDLTRGDQKERVQSPTRETISTSQKSWAKILDPSASQINVTSDNVGDRVMQNKSMEAKLESLNLDEEVSGQFSDAEDDVSLSDDEGDEYASIGDDFTDEECDVYILDPDELDQKRTLARSIHFESKEPTERQGIETEQVISELDEEFPSLIAASTVPYEGSDDEETGNEVSSKKKLMKAAEEDRKRREASLKPVTNSGKLYNSFRGYKDIVKAGGAIVQPKKKETTKIEKSVEKKRLDDVDPVGFRAESHANQKSRVMGGVGISGQSAEVEDDGEGWITSATDIVAMKVTGTLDPFGSAQKNSQMKVDNQNLPPKTKRTACATTDFAMQNVILQMNLELLSVDGVKVRKLKSWVTRCAVCFKLYTGSENDGKRLFCEKCGSSALQRIAASVDGKTGRLKLHLKKNYKSITRGTQFSLPKPGTQNKFMGDLLLAEDQMLYGAWNQRVKVTRSKKEKQSIFGSDIASNVGCHKDLTKLDGIKVGFGRKNPNSSKFGRERRGKKKKSTDKACGLRRY